MGTFFKKVCLSILVIIVNCKREGVKALSVSKIIHPNKTLINIHTDELFMNKLYEYNSITTYIILLLITFIRIIKENGLKYAFKDFFVFLKNAGISKNIDFFYKNRECIKWYKLRKRFLPHTKKDFQFILDDISSMQYKPQFSIIMPTYNSNIKYLNEAINSVRNQIYDNWELIICDDASTDSKVHDYLKKINNQDKRIKVIYRKKNGNICAATNSALKIANNDWVALMDHDDQLEISALYFMALYINKNPKCKMLYSDEDTFSVSGNYYPGYLKPEWDPILIAQQNFTSHLGVYNRSLLKHINGFREGFEGSQDWDLTLRCALEINEKEIIHVPLPLYHWRKPSTLTTFSQTQLEKCELAGRLAAKEYLDKLGYKANIEKNENSYNRIVWEEMENWPLVSVIILFKDKANMTENCLMDLLQTDYPNMEVIAIDNGSTKTETATMIKKFAEFKHVSFIRCDGPFSHSRLNNQAIKNAKGEYLLLLNNDTRMPEKRWLKEMVGWTQWNKVGAIGPKLLYPNGKVQHGGVFVSNRPAPSHIFIHHKNHTMARFGRLDLVQCVSGVTGACLLIKKSVFEEVGGFDENFPTSYNDVDLCLKVEQAGYTNIYIGTTYLVHLESVSRKEDVDGGKALKRLFVKWGSRLNYDRALHPFVLRPGCMEYINKNDAPYVPENNEINQWDK